jgi:hypothetical protein
VSSLGLMSSRVPGSRLGLRLRSDDDPCGKRRGTWTDEEHPLTLRQDNDEFDKLRCDHRLRVKAEAAAAAVESESGSTSFNRLTCNSPARSSTG